MCRVHGASHRSLSADNGPHIRMTMSKKELVSVDRVANEGVISSFDFLSRITFSLNLMSQTIRIESNDEHFLNHEITRNNS